LTGDGLSARLTALVILLRPPETGWLRGLLWLVAGIALAWPPASSSAAVWAVLAVLTAARVARDWPLADNHLYLLAYWCLALALAHATPTPSRTLGRSARWLVGLTFLCAAIWKAVLAPDFLDARFFRVTLLTDDRLAPLACAVGRMSAADLAESRAALLPVPAGVEVVNGPVLVEPPSLRALGLALTWGGLALEGALALVFLAPGSPRILQARHLLLIAFCASTYAVAPVAGFGWLLVAMGLSQLEERETALRAAYLAAFVIVLVYSETPLLPAMLAWASP
jgi:hypothetical protein